MKIYVIFLFFSEHRKMKKENLCQILIFQKNEKMKICGQFSSLFFFWTHNGNETNPEIKIQ